MVGAKDILLFVIVVCAAWIAQGFDCPLQGVDQCRSGVYTDNENCSFYFHCYPGEDGCGYNRQQCPDGLLFDYLYSVCSLPQVAVCLGELGVMSFAAISQDNLVSGPVNPVPFDVVYPNLGNHWNTANNQFLAPFRSVYYVSMSTGARNNSLVNYALDIDNTTFVNIDRASSAHDGTDTISRDIAVDVQPFQSMSFASNGASGLFSDSGLQTSVSIFSVNDAMSGLVVFSAGRDQPSLGIQNPYQFNVPIVNRGDGYDPNFYDFWVPATGIYYFSISVGVVQGYGVDFDLAVDGNKVIHLERNHTSHNADDHMGRGILLSLTEGQFVFCIHDSNEPIYSSPLYQTSFSGFRYNPRHQEPEAWSVGRKTNWSNSTDFYPVEFDEELVNEGLGWQDNVYTAQRAGYYFVHLTVGSLPNTPVDVAVLRNQQMAMSIQKTTIQNGVDTLSRSGMLYLNTDDVLGVRASGGTGMYSTDEYDTSFMGMLLYTDEALLPPSSE